MRKLLLLILMIGMLTSCHEKEGLKLEDCAYLVEVVRTEEVSSLELLSRLGVKSAALKAIIPKKTLKIASIKYNSYDSGKVRVLSGIIAYPTTLSEEKQKGAVLGVHFTIGSNAEAPSVRMAVHEAMFAAFDYVVVAPDYIGYGATADVVHPYHHAALTGDVSLDMCVAAKEYFATKAKRFPRDITIMGYSEGGYASIATLKASQEISEGLINFGIKEVFAGAGAYDLAASYDDFVAKDYSSQPVTIPMLMLGLDYGDKLGLDLTKMFGPKLLANYKEWILSKKYTTDEVTALIGTTKLTEFFAPEVFQKNHPNTVKFRESLEKNSLVKGWKPLVPVMLFHSKDDTIVPYVNTESAYNSFKNMPGVDVSLVTISGKDHKEAGDDFYLQCMLRMLNLKK